MPKPYRHKTVAGFFSAHTDRWIKGAMTKEKNGVSCFCFAGKVRDIYPEDEHENVFKKLADSIKALYPVPYRFARRLNPKSEDVVISFNDANRRTIEEIVNVAKHARV